VDYRSLPKPSLSHPSRRQDYPSPTSEVRESHPLMETGDLCAYGGEVLLTEGGCDFFERSGGLSLDCLSFVL